MLRQFDREGRPRGISPETVSEPMIESDRSRRERHNQAQIQYFERAGKDAMRPTDTPYVQRQVDRLIAFADLHPGQRVLDVGCGMGRYTFALADRGLVVEGLDLSEGLLERFRRHDAGRYGIPLHCADVLEPPETLHRRFDAVIGFFTLHHLDDVTGCLRAMRSLCRPNGRIAFLEPNPLNVLYYVQMLLVPGMSWSGDKGILGMTRGSMFAAMGAAGLSHPALERFGFLPPFAINRSWGPRLEERLERVSVWSPFLPFQLFRGDVPAGG
jgi:2-polyprenyl-3-methyl-5-hydroxy-6-metoxy-1,4-benzoquinol methylase